jgi:hypothetical protein
MASLSACSGGRKPAQEFQGDKGSKSLRLCYPGSVGGSDAQAKAPKRDAIHGFFEKEQDLAL